jgi:hypothetical protein
MDDVKTADLLVGAAMSNSTTLNLAIGLIFTSLAMSLSCQCDRRAIKGTGPIPAEKRYGIGAAD